MDLKSTLFIGLIFITSLVYSQQNKKTIDIGKADISPKIDGVLDDEAWVRASIAKNFTQFEPYNGAPSSEITEVKVCYDN